MGKDKQIDRKELFAVVLMAFLFVLIHSLAIIITGTFEDANMQAFENPNDPFNIAYIFVIIIIFTLVILLISRFWKKQLIQAIILAAIGYTSAYVFYPLFDIILNSTISFIFSIISAIILIIVLYKYPEWYIVDISGIIVGAGAIAIFGISLGIFLIIVLLIVLSIYDFISVYKTKHMIDLADTVMELKLPVLVVIPKIRRYSLIKETKRLKDQLKEGEEREAFFMGLGDIVMPGILVVATYVNITDTIFISLSVMLGTIIGFIVLMTFVIKGKPQAGLPCLCGGAILGYLISSLVIFGELRGLTFFF
jgi:presenilin-like A22 family membrane protease